MFTPAPFLIPCIYSSMLHISSASRPVFLHQELEQSTGTCTLPAFILYILQIEYNLCIYSVSYLFIRACISTLHHGAVVINILFYAE